MSIHNTRLIETQLKRIAEALEKIAVQLGAKE